MYNIYYIHACLLNYLNSYTDLNTTHHLSNFYYLPFKFNRKKLECKFLLTIKTALEAAANYHIYFTLSKIIYCTDYCTFQETNYEDHDAILHTITHHCSITIIIILHTYIHIHHLFMSAKSV